MGIWLRNHSCWSQQSVQYHQDGNPPNIHPWVKVRAILFNQLWQNNCMCLQQTITIAAIEWTNTINHITSIATRLNNEIFDIDLALLLNFQTAASVCENIIKWASHGFGFVDFSHLFKVYYLLQCKIFSRHFYGKIAKNCEQLAKHCRKLRWTFSYNVCTFNLW